MSFSYTIEKTIQLAGGRIACGTYTNSSSTGGDVYTGLQNVYSFFIQPKGSSVVTNQPAVNETLPKSDVITIVTANNEVGTWTAFGE